jgi:ribose transport system permease protein
MTPTASTPARSATDPVTVEQPPTADEGEHRFRSLLLRQETTLIAVIVVIGALTAAKNPNFLDRDNLAEILRSSVIYFVAGCGTAVLVIGGGLDFSIGASFALAGLIAAKFMADGLWWPLAVLIGLAMAALMGVVNHVVITYLHVPPIIATLGTFFIVIGLNAQLTSGVDVVDLPQGFLVSGQGTFASISNVIWYAIAVGVVFWFLLEHTRFGVNLRALGGNRQAAIGNGIRVIRLDLTLYVLGALMAGTAGIIYSARVGAGQVEAGGSATTLTVITAVLIGGVSLLGGLGTITGVAAGAVLLSLIDNALVLAEIPPQYNTIIVGATLIAAVAVDHLRRQQLYKRR